MTTTRKSVLGMYLDELSLRDIKEEISDLSRDLNTILDFEEGMISGSELHQETTFEPEDKQKIIDAIDELRAEVKRRNDGF